MLGCILPHRDKVDVFAVEQRTDVFPCVGKGIVGGYRQHHRTCVSQVRFDGKGDAGVGDAVCQLAQGVAGAGCDQQYIQQLFWTDGFGLGQSVPNLTSADFLDG